MMNDTTGATTQKRIQVDHAVAKIRKKFGTGDTGLLIGRASDIKPRRRIPTGIFTLDRALQGGLPMGQWNTIYGDPQSGKSSMSAMIIAEAQRMGLVTVYVNAEGRLEKEWFAHLGVDLGELYILDPLETSAEIVLDTYIGMAKDRAVDLVVIDSISALPPREELDKTMEESSMALMARLLSRFFRDTTGLNSAANVCGLIIAQTRSSMSQYARKLDSLSCGNAIKFYSQYILNTGRKNPQTTHVVDRDSGFIFTIDIAKATGPGQGTRLEYEFVYDVGINKALDIINAGLEEGIIEKGGGGNYTLSPAITGGEEAKVRGLTALMDHVNGNPDVVDRVRRILCNSE